MSQEEWVTNFKMTLSDFLNLVELIRPFAKDWSTKVRNDVITLEKRILNQMLHSARNQVEHAVGRLKARWRILLRPIKVNMKNVLSIILSCFVLHNYCKKQHVSLD